MKKLFYLFAVLTCATTIFAAEALPDSLILVDIYTGKTYKDIYTYDAMGHTMSTLYQVKDAETNTWSNTDLFEYTRNAKGQTLTYIHRIWDKTTTNWVFSAKTEYTYDDNGNTLASIQSTWDKESGWVYGNKRETTYNATGSILIYSTWSAGTWKEVYRVITVITGNTITETTQSIGVDDYRVTYTYDANGNLKSEVEEVADDMEQLVLSKQLLYTYDDNNRLIETITQHYNASAKDWVNYLKTTNTYEGNNLVETHNYAWTSGDWVSANKRQITYDANGNILTEITSLYNSASKTWTGSYMFEYTYNEQGWLLTQINSSWNKTTGDWDITTIQTYYYPTSPTAIDQLNHQSQITNGKSIINGHLLIHHGNQTFDARGARVE